MLSGPGFGHVLEISSLRTPLASTRDAQMTSGPSAVLGSSARGSASSAFPHGSV